MTDPIAAMKQRLVEIDLELAQGSTEAIQRGIRLLEFKADIQRASYDNVGFRETTKEIERLKRLL